MIKRGEYGNIYYCNVKNNLTLGRLKDYFGVFDKGVWAVSSCLTRVSLNITFGKRVIFFYV